MAADRLEIDLVSDFVCPWCALGWLELERALEAVDGEVPVDLRFAPFELDPATPPGGVLVSERMRARYGEEARRFRAVFEEIRARAGALGFEMADRADRRAYNTFAAHQLMSAAAREGRAPALARELFRLAFGEGADLADAEILAGAARATQVSARGVKTALSGALAAEVRAEEALWRREGVTGVPTVRLAGRYVIIGAQTSAAYARATRRVWEEISRPAAPPPSA